MQKVQAVALQEEDVHIIDPLLKNVVIVGLLLPPREERAGFEKARAGLHLHRRERPFGRKR